MINLHYKHCPICLKHLDVKFIKEDKAPSKFRHNSVRVQCSKSHYQLDLYRLLQMNDVNEMFDVGNNLLIKNDINSGTYIDINFNTYLDLDKPFVYSEKAVEAIMLLL